MDRLARNLDDLRKVVKTIIGKGTKVEFIKENLAFTGEDSPMSNLLLNMLRVLRLQKKKEHIKEVEQSYQKIR